jgi:hypothetical protein
MKKSSFVLVLTILLLTVPLAAQDKTLDSLDEIMTAFKKGDTVRAIFTYKDMQLISDNEIVERVPDAIGGMTLDTFEYFAAKSIGNPEAYVASSKAVLINHPSYGVVYNYAKVKVYESGKVVIVAQYLDPRTFEIKMNESFYAAINQGARFFRK